MLNINKEMSLERVSMLEKVRIRTWLLVVYLFFAPLDFLPVIPGISISRFLILVPLFGCILYMNSIKIRQDRFIVLPILYVIILISTLFYSYDVILTRQRVITVGLNIAVILILSMFNYNEREVGTLKKAIVYSGWFTLLLMLFYTNTSMMDGRITVVINGIAQDPNYLTGFLIFSTIYYLDEFIQKRKKISIIKIIVFITFIFFTGSRGGLLAIISSIVFYIITWIKDKGFKFFSIIKLIAIGVLIGITVYIILDTMPTSISRRYDIAYTLRDGGANRFALFKSAIYEYKTFPLFNMIFGQGSGTIQYFTYSGHVAHNVWIESLIEIGVIGTGTLLVLYISYFKRIFKMKDYIITASFVGYMMMTMSMSLYSYKPIWNIMLMIMILKNSKYYIKSSMKKDT